LAAVVGSARVSLNQGARSATNARPKARSATTARRGDRLGLAPHLLNVVASRAPISTRSSVLEVREQSPAGDDARPQRQRQARGQPSLERCGGAAIPPGDLAERAEMKDRGVESRQHEEQELQSERRIAGELGRVSDDTEP